MKHKVYVASSWRNKYQPEVVEALRAQGHEVYDFRNPPNGGHGFKWSEIDEGFENWTPAQCREGLSHPLAQKQLKNDVDAMQECDVCVLVLPCGRSAHMEAGWFCSKGKKVYVLIPEAQEPELMYGMFEKVCVSIEEIKVILNYEF